MRTLLILIPWLLISTVSAASPDLTQLIRIRLQKNLKTLGVSGTGLSITGMESEDPMRWSRREIRWEKARGAWRVTDLLSGKSSWVAGRQLRVSGGDLQSSYMALPSRLILVARGSSFDLIAQEDFRRYLIGVVGHEMPRSWPLETLKAQAVAARSYALAVQAERRQEDWHVEASIEDQVFRSVDENREDLRVAREAVIQTDGRVLRTGAGRLVKAYYHSDCGGRTLSAKQVWGDGQDTGTAVDEFCPSNPKAQWEVSFPASELARKFSLDSALASLSLEKGRAGAQIVRLAGERGQREVAANDFRLKLGSTDLRSTNFEVTVNGGQVNFKGRGFGHGVGLCQWGSRTLGLRGRTSDEILAHYYPKARQADWNGKISL